MNTQLTEKADRIGTLEKQQEEKNQHMAFQVTYYTADNWDHFKIIKYGSQWDI